MAIEIERDGNRLVPEPLLAAFNIVSPIVLIGALIVLRARKTIVEDVQAIFESMVAAAPCDQDQKAPHREEA